MAAFLNDVVAHPECGIAERYKRLGISVRQGQKLKFRLLEAGYDRRSRRTYPHGANSQAAADEQRPAVGCHIRVKSSGALMNPSGIVRLIKASPLRLLNENGGRPGPGIHDSLSSATARAAEVVASHDTRFWINGTWVPAEDLKVGDVFMTPDGKQAIVRDVETVSMDDATCYGLITDSTLHRQADTQVSAVAHGNWIDRWWRRVRAFFK